MADVLMQLRQAAVESRFIMPFEPNELETDGTILLHDDNGNQVKIGVINETN
jgi:hypothetical protein